MRKSCIFVFCKSKNHSIPKGIDKQTRKFILWGPSFMFCLGPPTVLRRLCCHFWFQAEFVVAYRAMTDDEEESICKAISLLVRISQKLDDKGPLPHSVSVCIFNTQHRFTSFLAIYTDPEIMLP